MPTRWASVGCTQAHAAAGTVYAAASTVYAAASTVYAAASTRLKVKCVVYPVTLAAC